MKLFKYLAYMAAGALATVALTGCSDDDDEPEDTTSTIVERSVRRLSNGTPDLVIYRYTDRGEGVGTTTWVATEDVPAEGTNPARAATRVEHILDGRVFVNEGQVLTINAGAVIKGAPGQGADASALVVARGGQIQAVGNSTTPIVFTSESDEVYRSSTDGTTYSIINNDLQETARGLWGGLIVLGRATQNTSPSTQFIEGIPTTEPRGEYGGTNDADNSGTIQYVSIRHGGTNIGANNEINGLTMGAVGNGTTIRWVEVFANNDDAFEWFGGTVNTRNLVGVYCDDDIFDYDQGWRGNNQFWFGIIGNTGNSDTRGGEFDGGTSPENGTPLAQPTMFNVTLFGNKAVVPSTDRRAATFRDNAAGFLRNSFFADFGRGIDIEDAASGGGTDDAVLRASNKQLVISHCSFAGIGDQTATVSGGTNRVGVIYARPEGTETLTQAEADSVFVFLDPTRFFNENFGAGATQGTAVPFSTTSGITLDALPTGLSTTTATVPTTPTGFYMQTSYRGAFDPALANMSATWMAGWTFLDQAGYF